jgi:hypothetical protein
MLRTVGAVFRFVALAAMLLWSRLNAASTGRLGRLGRRTGSQRCRVGLFGRLRRSGLFLGSPGSGLLA